MDHILFLWPVGPLNPLGPLNLDPRVVALGSWDILEGMIGRSGSYGGIWEKSIFGPGAARSPPCRRPGAESRGPAVGFFRFTESMHMYIIYLYIYIYLYIQV